ncbi:MAG: hypothetical protein ACK4IY_04240, partial [Chitinophagales bacterium]
AAHTQSAFAIGDEKTEVCSRIQQPVYVVLSNTAEVDAAIQSALEKYWTLSEYVFISKEEYKEVKATKDVLYMMIVQNEGVDGSTFTYENVLQTFYLVRNGTYRINVSGVPVRTDATNESIEIANAIRILQDKIAFRIAKEQQQVEYAAYNEAANARVSIVKAKTLYITTDDLDKTLAGLTDIQAVYSGEVVLVSKSELDHIIEKNNPNTAYVVIENYKSGINYINSKKVIDAESGMVLYINEGKSIKPAAFSKNDFIALQNN